MLLELGGCALERHPPSGDHHGLAGEPQRELVNCSTSSTATPESAIDFTMGISLMNTTGASPSGISSIRSTRGFAANAPREHDHLLLASRQQGRGRVDALLQLGELLERGIRLRRVRAVCEMFSRTVSDGKTVRPCSMNTIPRRARVTRDSLSIGSPSSSIRPDECRVTPEIDSIRLVLPAPFGAITSGRSDVVVYDPAGDRIISRCRAPHRMWRRRTPMNIVVERSLQILRQLRGPEASEAVYEASALIVGALFFVIGFAVGFPVFFGHELAITGQGSIGVFAAIGGAIVAASAFLIGRLSKRPTGAEADAVRDGFAVPGDRLRWYDLTAIAFAHAAVAYLGWLGVSGLLERSFTDAPVFAFPGAILVSVAFALTAYISFLSAVALTPMSLSLVLAVFLVVGAFASMLASSDPHWWQDNLSALGMSTNSSSLAFNVTLIIAGVMVTTISRYATAGLPVDDPAQRRGRFIVRGGLILMGVFLACVGIFPVDEFFVVHNTVATGMAVVFAVVVVGLPWFVRSIPRVFVAFGWIYVLVIAMLGVFFAVGYYNLTAVELIAAVLIFSWIIVFLRTAGSVMPAGARDQAAEVVAA